MSTGNASDDLSVPPKKQKTVDVREEAVFEFNLLPTAKKKKHDAQSWTKYLSQRRAMHKPAESGHEESIARGKLDEALKSFACDGVGDDGSGMIQRWKEGVRFAVLGASIEEDDSFRRLAVRSTFFSPYATPRAVQVSTDCYTRFRYNSTEHYHRISIRLLSFHPTKEDPKAQKIVAVQAEPSRMDLKGLNEKKVTQICKHLEIDSNDVTKRYILIKLLLFASDVAETSIAGLYVPDREKIKKMEGINEDEKRMIYRDHMTWLDYGVRVASKKLKPYHKFFKLVTPDDDREDGSDY